MNDKTMPMYKIIFFIAIIALAHCKTTEPVVHQTEDMAMTNDTTVVEKGYLYRGDSLTTFITMVGDTIISKRTSKMRSDDEMESFTTKKRFKRGPAKGVEVADVMMMESTPPPDVSSSSPVPMGDRIKPVMPQHPDAGQITAGEWNDLNNWDDWKTLLNDNDYFNMQDHWGIYLTQRFSVFITNHDNIPLVDLRVDLLEAGNTIWSARTDHSGRAELWSGMNNKKQKSKSALSALVHHKGKTTKINVNNGESAHLKINNSCNTAHNVDIMFVVDATGSMGDEINYLKAELKDVIKKSTQSNGDVDLRVGSVFYRDMDDNYLTKVSPLNKNLDKVYDFIGEQSAQGGGDYPEAVDAAMEEALAQKWSENAIARIVFLLLDAPPHEDEQIKSTLRDQIAEAAEKGIKIVPISASGINREAEFLLKFMSIATNGTYVFITDDSGIGGKHLDPVVSDFEVEKLNDLLVRVISNYTAIKSCHEKVVTDQSIKVFPNPTSNFVTIDIAKNDIGEVRVISSTGKIMYKTKVMGESIKIDMSQYVDGIYTIQCIGSDMMYSNPVIKVSE